MKTKPDTPLERAILAAGGVASLADACNVSKQAVYKWRARGWPPVVRCIQVETASNGAVSRFALLPENFAIEQVSPTFSKD